MSVAIAIESLTKRFGRTLAVDDLSFTVPQGRIVGFLGPNGAGKTTTLRVLLGLARADGRATIEGRRYADLRDPATAVGALVETQQFHPGRSGRDHLRMLAVAAGVPFGRVEELLRLVALDGAARRPVGGYSLGMRQRLGLAAALLGSPRILILDEPANGLDPQGMRWLRGFLRSYAESGRTILISSHLLSEMAQIVDEVVVINQGRLVVQGQVGDLVAGSHSLEDIFLELTAAPHGTDKSVDEEMP